MFVRKFQILFVAIDRHGYLEECPVGSALWYNIQKGYPWGLETFHNSFPHAYLLIV
jgi:hypothetical protein